MACEYCFENGGLHHPRCPLYEESKAAHYCSICNEAIYYGEEYIINNDDEYAHKDCFSNTRYLVEWLGFEVKTMEDDYD